MAESRLRRFQQTKVAAQFGGGRKAWFSPARQALDGRALPCVLLGLGEAEVIRPVPPGPLVDHLVGIVAPADAAVVAGERLAHIVALALQIEAQNRAAH